MIPFFSTTMKKALCLVLLLGLARMPLRAQQWTLHYKEEYPEGRTHFYDGWVDPEGVAFLAGEEGTDYGHPHALLMRIEPDGRHTEFHYHRPGCYTKATCLIETSNRNLFVAGNCSIGGQDSLLLLLFDKDLNLLVERCYGKDRPAGPFGSCKALCDPYGQLILATTVSVENEYHGTEHRGVFLKFNAHGELLHQRYLMADYPDPLYDFMDFNLRQLWYRPEDETLLCLAPASGGVMSFVRFDTLFNYLEAHPIWRDETDKSDHTLFRDCYTDHWYSDHEALFFSSRGDADHNKLRISRVSTEGDFLEFIHLNERPDTIDDAARHRCMAKANDSTFYFGFHTHTVGYHPGVSGVYRINDQLEITGRHLDDDHDHYRSWMVLPTPDGGCLSINDSCAWASTANLGHPVIRKLLPDDFESVTCTVLSAFGGQHLPHPYPNPAETVLTIPLQQLPTRFQVFDGQGRLLCDRLVKGQGNYLQFDVSGLRPGLYCFRLFQDGHPPLQGTFLKQ